MLQNWLVVLLVVLILLAMFQGNNEDFLYYQPYTWYHPGFEPGLYRPSCYIPHRQRRIRRRGSSCLGHSGRWWPWGYYKTW